MVSEEEFEELKDRVWELEEQVTVQQQYITDILRQIPEIPERGMARFDAATWESPSEVHTTFLTIQSVAEGSPDGYATRKEVKQKLAADNDMLKTEVKGYFKRLLEEDIIEEHPGDSSRIKPNPDASKEQAADLFVSNFDQADARRKKAERRGKPRDRER